MNNDVLRFRRAYEFAISSFHEDPRNRALLNALPASSWERGGCAAFACALTRILGGELISLGWYAVLADHVAVSLHGLLLNSEGAHSPSELVAKYSLLAEKPIALWPLTRATVVPPSGDADAREALATLLEPYLHDVATLSTSMLVAQPAIAAG
jgi:hypothetical protein